MPLLAAGLLCRAQAPHNALTPQEKAAGWILLFDGRNLAQWDDPARKSPPGDAWSIEDGCIKAKAKPRIGEDLFSREKFTNFELAWEWRISPRGNSGVKYRVQDRFFLGPTPGITRFEDQVAAILALPRLSRPQQGYEYVVAFEYQMLDEGPGPLSSHSPGAIYDAKAPSQRAERPAGEFNQSRIVLRGNHVEHWLNGVKVVDANLDDPDLLAGPAQRWGATSKAFNLLKQQPLKTTPITLQNHDNEAWFRDLKIRRLD